MTAEKEYTIDLSEQQKKFCLDLHYNCANSYVFVNGIEIYKFKAKKSEINAVPLCSGNVSKNFSTDNIKNTGIYRYVYYFSVDYDSTNVANILDIHKYLMAKNSIK